MDQPIKSLRERMADYLEKAVEKKTETVFVPAAENEFQQHLSRESVLQMVDVLIPMVKGEINKLKPKTDESAKR